MISLDALRTAASVLREAGKIEQYKQILEVQEKLLEMQEENTNLKSDLKKLQERLKTRDSLIYDKNCYWKQNEEKEDGPFCSRCWDKDNILIRMYTWGNRSFYECPECKTHVEVYEDRGPGILVRNSDSSEDPYF